ncbi:hypothetical protein P879_01643 [Paragonimus westermani]|uniref:Uncharacterized protein n=1 Tax=Paragonimus westermani TaxID=34504 RepID=A0A8T0DVD6_9TREM|nr:hypothetical protein P879_01643 [Paragonimus westermani]
MNVTVNPIGQCVLIGTHHTSTTHGIVPGPVYQQSCPEVSDATSSAVDCSCSALVPTSSMSTEPAGVVMNARVDCTVTSTEDQVPSAVRAGEQSTQCQSLPDMPQTNTDRPTSPTDPYKRARKFLCDLAPLLKLSLPSRVERKRTASVFHPRHQPTRVSNSGPSISDLRVSVCAKQWTKYGVLIVSQLFLLIHYFDNT